MFMPTFLYTHKREKQVVGVFVGWTKGFAEGLVLGGLGFRYGFSCSSSSSSSSSSGSSSSSRRLSAWQQCLSALYVLECYEYYADKGSRIDCAWSSIWTIRLRLFVQCMG